MYEIYTTICINCEWFTVLERSRQRIAKGMAGTPGWAATEDSAHEHILEDAREFLSQNFFQKYFKKENPEGSHMKQNVGCWRPFPQNTSSNHNYLEHGTRLLLSLYFPYHYLLKHMVLRKKLPLLPRPDLLTEMCGNYLQARFAVYENIFYTSYEFAIFPFPLCSLLVVKTEALSMTFIH